MSKYGVFSSPYFPVFTGKYGPEKTPYFDTFHPLLRVFFEMQNAKMLYRKKGTKYISNGISRMITLVFMN